MEQKPWKWLEKMVRKTLNPKASTAFSMKSHGLICWLWCSLGRGWARRTDTWAGVGPAVLMDFLQPVGLCVRTQTLGVFFSCWGNLFLFLKMHKLQVIYFLFCFFSIQFAPGVNSLSFSFCWGGGGRVVDDKTDSGGCELYYWTSASQNTFLSKCGMCFLRQQITPSPQWSYLGLASSLQSEEVIYE